MPKFIVPLTNPSTKGQKTCIIKIDEKDAWLLRSQVWKAHEHVPNAKTKINYTLSRYLNGVTLTLGRVITQPKEDEKVIHLDGDSLNFKRENLQIVNKSDFQEFLKEKRLKLNAAPTSPK